MVRSFHWGLMKRPSRLTLKLGSKQRARGHLTERQQGAELCPQLGRKPLGRPQKSRRSARQCPNKPLHVSLPGSILCAGLGSPCQTRGRWGRRRPIPLGGSGAEEQGSKSELGFRRQFSGLAGKYWVFIPCPVLTWHLYHGDCIMWKGLTWVHQSPQRKKKTKRKSTCLAKLNRIAKFAFSNQSRHQ